MGHMYTDGSGGPRWVPRRVPSARGAVATVKLDTGCECLRTWEIGILIALAPGRAIWPHVELWVAIVVDRVAPEASSSSSLSSGSAFCSFT